MIYDRTNSDIVKAKKIFTEKVQNFIPLTDDEQAIMDRAFFNLKALNRITQKLLEIWGAIVYRGGERVSDESVREWSGDEIFRANHFSGIFNNISAAVTAIGELGIDNSSLLTELEKLEAMIASQTYMTYAYNWLNVLEHLLQMMWDSVEVVWAYQVGDILYIEGAYSATREAEVLNIE